MSQTEHRTLGALIAKRGPDPGLGLFWFTSVAAVVLLGVTIYVGIVGEFAVIPRILIGGVAATIIGLGLAYWLLRGDQASDKEAPFDAEGRRVVRRPSIWWQMRYTPSVLLIMVGVTVITMGLFDLVTVMWTAILANIALLCAWVAFMSLRNSTRMLYLHEDGFIYALRKEIFAARWEDIEAVWMDTQVGSKDHDAILKGLTIRRKDQAAVQVSGVKGIAQLLGFIQERTYPPFREAAQQTYEQEGTVSFGPVMLTPEGVWYRFEGDTYRFLWDDYDLTTRLDAIAFKRKTDGQIVLGIPMGLVPNFDVFNDFLSANFKSWLYFDLVRDLADYQRKILTEDAPFELTKFIIGKLIGL